MRRSNCGGMTRQLMVEAASKGADVVLLEADNVRSSRRISKNGTCLRW